MTHKMTSFKLGRLNGVWSKPGAKSCTLSSRNSKASKPSSSLSESSLSALCRNPSNSFGMWRLSRLRVPLSGARREKMELDVF